MWREQHGEGSCPWIKLPEQAVQILVCTFLPGTIWVGKIDLAMQSFFNAAPVGKLRAPVAGNSLDQLRRKAGQCSDNGVLMMVSAVGPTSSWQCKTESCAPPGGKAGFFCLATHHCIRFPNARLLTAVYDLSLLRSTFPYCISLAFLSLRSSFPCGAVLSDCHLPGIS